MKRKTFQECCIHYKITASPTPIEIIKIFKPDFSGPDGLPDWVTYTSNDNNNFEIKCGKCTRLYYRFSVKKL